MYALAGPSPCFDALLLNAVAPHLLDAAPQVVERAQRWAEGLGLAGRVRYARANATISLRSMLESYPGGLDLVTIQASSSTA